MRRIEGERSLRETEKNRAPFGRKKIPSCESWVPKMAMACEIIELELSLRGHCEQLEQAMYSKEAKIGNSFVKIIIYDLFRSAM